MSDRLRTIIDAITLAINDIEADLARAEQEPGMDNLRAKELDELQDHLERYWRAREILTGTEMALVPGLTADQYKAIVRTEAVYVADSDAAAQYRADRLRRAIGATAAQICPDGGQTEILAIQGTYSNPDGPTPSSIPF